MRNLLLEYKLLAIDLDGTLLNEEHQLSPQIVAAIEEIVNKGLKVTIATNRMFRSAENLAKRLNIDLPLITDGGSLVKSSHTKEKYLDLRITKEIAERAINLMNGEDSTHFLFQGDEVYTPKRSWYTENYQTVAGIEIKIVPDLKEILDEKPRAIIFYVNIEEVQRLTMKLKIELESIARITNSAPYFIDVLNLKATKALGLEKIAKHFNIKRDEIIAVGDGMNDIEMIEYAGLGIAVANASNSLKEKADYITKSEREKGVLEVINNFILKETN